MDFTPLLPSTFGISTQSFVPSLLDRKDKSHLAKIKARRRSNIGVRGSPETNALIRFMAQHRAKTPLFCKTPEAVKSSPSCPRVSSTLKEKMASFQVLMDVEEREGCDPVAGPKQDLSDGNLDSDKENCSQRSMPSKRRRAGPPGDCEAEIRGASSPILQHYSSQADSEETPFELQSSSVPQPVELVAVDLPAQRALPFPSSSSIPALLEMKPFEVALEANSTVKKNKKRVRFGGPLSPELFDKNLPPSTPLQKGTTPARNQTPGPGLDSGLRSLLKTPQRPVGWSPLPQPLFCSPTFFGSSPTFSLPRQRSAQTPENNCEKVVLLLLLQSPRLNPLKTPRPPQRSPSNPSRNLDLNQSPLRTLRPAPTGRAERSKAQPTSTAPAPVSQKRKLLQESEPFRRSSRSAAKSASGKMKKAHRWASKEVDRSLYGSRDYASKNPALSPITEGLSPSPAPQPPRSRKHSEVEAVEGVGRPEGEMATQATSMETEAPVDLAPWQTDFTLEDVFKPVATRGQRSVRRSLRNHSNNEERGGGGGSGLAWVPHTSPESLRATRRRSRGRRLSSTPAPQTPLEHSAAPPSSAATATLTLCELWSTESL
ncbi:unnamed protein product [Merluccius merluccius]